MGSDTERIAALVSHLAQHWRGARVAIWLPLRDDGRAERMCARRVGPSTTRLVHRHGPPQRRLPGPLHHLSSATPAAPFLLHPPSAHTLTYLPAVAPATTDASYSASYDSDGDKQEPKKDGKGKKADKDGGYGYYSGYYDK